MVRKVSALKVGKSLGQLLEGVYHKGDQYVIERDGQPMAAVVPVWQLKEWQDRRARFFGMVDALRSTGKKRRPQLVEREVQAAVRAVRGDRRRTG
jgi:hypothetical protein